MVYAFHMFYRKTKQTKTIHPFPVSYQFLEETGSIVPSLSHCISSCFLLILLENCNTAPKDTTISLVCIEEKNITQSYIFKTLYRLMK